MRTRTDYGNKALNENNNDGQGKGRKTGRTDPATQYWRVNGLRLIRTDSKL